jgi:hypothetical protein
MSGCARCGDLPVTKNTRCPNVRIEAAASARFISENVDIVAFRAAGTRAGGEIAPLP